MNRLFFVRMKCTWQFNIVKKEGFERSAAQIGRIIKTFSTQLVGENQEKSETRLYRALPRKDRYLAQNGFMIGMMGLNRI